MRHIEAYSGIIEGYRAIIRHIRNSAKACIDNRGMFRTLLAYLEPEASSKAF